MSEEEKASVPKAAEEQQQFPLNQQSIQVKQAWWAWLAVPFQKTVGDVLLGITSNSVAHYEVAHLGDKIMLSL